MAKRNVVFICLTCIVILFPAFAGADPRFAKLYFDSARALAAGGRSEEAGNLLETSFQFKPLYSDAFYLKAFLLSERGKRREAVEASASALKAGNWDYYEPFDGVLLAARLLADVRRYGEALELLESYRPRSEREADPVYIRIRCRFGLKERGRALAELTKAVELFPEDYRFLELAFRTKGTEPASSLFLSRRSSNPEFLSAFLAYIEQDGPVEEKRALADEYYRLGGTSPRASCVLIESGSADGKEIERFFAKGGLGFLDLCRRCLLSLKGKERGIFEERLLGFTGLMTTDDDLDGIPETMYSVSSGSPVMLSFDEDQDGTGEASVSFKDGLPVKASLVGESFEFSVDYADYPFVEKSMIRSKRGELKTYFAVPGGFSLPLLKDLPVATDRSERLLHPYRMDKGRAFLDNGELARTAYKIEEKLPSSSNLFRYQVKNGEILKLEEITASGTGERVRRRVDFSRGKPVSGERDLDLDGRFDLREIYSGGVLTALEFGKGPNPAYREKLAPIRVKEWDLNGDGLIDAKEYRNGPGRVREFSSLFDGAFDALAVDPQRLWKPLAALDGVMKE